MVRIRYIVDEDGCFQSSRVIPTNSGDVLVKYNPNNMVVHIFRANNTEDILATFISTSLVALKRDIKKNLSAMGANFETEGRAPRVRINRS